MAKKTPEGYVLSAVLDYLAVQGIFAMRMNSGAIQDKRGIPVRMHASGTADVLALPSDGTWWRAGKNDAQITAACWIECKAPKGKQSDLQKEFQERVEAEGHVYILAHGIDDLIKAGL